jgi:hypothetical protein
MRQIKYNFATNYIRCEFPDEWEPADITAVSLTITDRDGNVLQAATAATLYTATDLHADVAAYQEEIVLAAGSGALEEGDVIWIDGVAGYERHRVKGYDSTTRTATLEEILEQAHEEDDAVYPCWVTSAAIDTTTVATWTAGLPVTLTWTPTGSGQAFVEMAEVSKYSMAAEGLELRFKAIYWRAWDDFEKKGTFSIIREEAERQLRSELASNGLDYNRIVDNDIFSPVLMARMAWLWTLNGDENKEDERKTIGAEYNALLAQLLKNPIWVDTDQDLVEDEGEVSDHQDIFFDAWS